MSAKFRAIIGVLFGLLATMLVHSQTAGAAEDAPLSPCQQLVLVTAPDWDSSTATLQRFEREAPDADWKPVAAPIPVVVGRRGLAWGLGLYGEDETSGPLKREGDGRAPAGVFELTSAFGTAATSDVAWIRMPYRQLMDGVECIDDSDSRHYNRILDRAEIVEPDWSSSEKMARPVEEYRWGVVVGHNAGPRVPGAGSCIFLHVWESSTSGTAGCTAMSRENMEELLRWLDPAKQPRLVQLPEAERAALAEQVLFMLVP